MSNAIMNIIGNILQNISVPRLYRGTLGLLILFHFAQTFIDGFSRIEVFSERW
jgi:hypothetical protein